MQSIEAVGEIKCNVQRLIIEMIPCSFRLSGRFLTLMLNIAGEGGEAKYMLQYQC